MSEYEVKKFEDRIEYYYEGKLHRDNDLPAREFTNGTKVWYQYGKFHRLDGPAYECLDGYKEWYIEGIEYTEEEWKIKVLELSKYEVKKFDNRIEYYYEGKLHRNNDLPAIEYKNGSKYWFQNGKLHRDNGPAEEFSNGVKIWYKNGLTHRLDGPAYEYKENKEWYIEGKEYTEEEFNNKIQQLPNILVINGRKYKLVEY
jgi:hypothetical protein